MIKNDIYIILIILLRIIYIKADSNSENNENDANSYLFGELSNLKCSSDFITSFEGKTYIKTPINSNITFSFSFLDQQKDSHYIECTIMPEKIIRLLTENDSNSKKIIKTKSKKQRKLQTTPQENAHNDTGEESYIYKTICEFKGMIKKDFQVTVSQELSFKMEKIPDNIEIYYMFEEDKTFNINRCMSVNNTFLQVSKYKTDESGKKIFFLFISKALRKIDKNEQIDINISLKKKDGSLSESNATCTIKEDVEPIEGEEILAFYYCEVNNIEKPSEYKGLVFASSLDVKDIPSDENLKDPVITDESINEGKIKDYSLITFNSVSIDIKGCENNGTFKIKGNTDRKTGIISPFKINLNLKENENVVSECSIPTGDKGEIYIICQVEKNFFNTSINIPQIIVNNSNKEGILNITKISYENMATCIIIPLPLPQTTIIQTTSITTTTPITITTTTTISPILKLTKIESEIIFRQISHFNIDENSHSLKFNLIGFTFVSIKKDSYLSINLNLIKSDGNKEENSAYCVNNNDITGSAAYLTPLYFDCEIDGMNNPNEYTDIKVISTPFLSNIQNINSNLLNAQKTDELIEKGLVLDYMKKDNFNRVPPKISNSNINVGSCNLNGTFEIESYAYSQIEKDISFYLGLTSPKMEVRCKVPSTEANSNIFIQCKTLDKIDNSIIKIDSKIVYDLDYNELFYMVGIESKNYATCKDNNEIKIEEAQQKVNAVISFRQASKFRKESNKYKFFLSTFIKTKIESNMKIKMKVEIKSETDNKINEKISNKRRLSRREELDVECSLLSNTDLNDDGVGAAGFECTTSETTINDANGLDIKGSGDISGIPEDPDLIDPAKTDTLIDSGQMKDYSLEENLNELLPLFNTLSVNTSLCKQNGSLYIKGNISSTIKDDVLFNLSLSYPESIFACKLPRTLKYKITEIECFNRDYFENSTVIVEETVIRDGFHEFFILKNITSGEEFVTCTYSGKETNKSDYESDFKITRTIKKNTSSGGGGMGVVGIVIICVVGAIIVAGVIVLSFYIRKKIKPSNDAQDTRSINSKSFSTTSY